MLVLIRIRITIVKPFGPCRRRTRLRKRRAIKIRLSKATTIPRLLAIRFRNVIADTGVHGLGAVQVDVG